MFGEKLIKILLEPSLSEIPGHQVMSLVMSQFALFYIWRELHPGAQLFLQHTSNTNIPAAPQRLPEHQTL